MDERFDSTEVAAAEALDDEITIAVDRGPAPTADPVVVWLTAAVRSAPPARLAGRVRAELARIERRRWRPLQLVAAALAALFLSQGLSNLVNGDWVAQNLGEAYSQHAATESGLALLAAGMAVAGGLFRLSWLPLSVAVGAPLGLAFGVTGIGEVGEFTAGAVLHLGQGAGGVALAVLWWRTRRYGAAPTDEHGA